MRKVRGRRKRIGPIEFESEKKELINFLCFPELVQQARLAEI